MRPARVPVTVCGALHWLPSYAVSLSHWLSWIHWESLSSSVHCKTGIVCYPRCKVVGVVVRRRSTAHTSRAGRTAGPALVGPLPSMESPLSAATVVLGRLSVVLWIRALLAGPPALRSEGRKAKVVHRHWVGHNIIYL